MKSTTLLSILLSTSLTLATPIHRVQHTQPSAVYSMTSFTTHKHDGQTINALSFNIISANGENVNTTCSAYDPTLGGDTNSFESGKVYLCGEGSMFSFAYTPGAAETVDDLVLWQRVNDGTETWRGSTTPASGEACTPGGDGDKNLICVAPDNEDAYIEMRKASGQA